MKNRQSGAKTGLIGLVGGAILAVGIAGLVGGCNSSNSSQKPTKKDYNETSIIESEYEKLEKNILTKVKKIATLDPNELELGFFGKKIGEKGYTVHYEGKDKEGNEFDIFVTRPEYAPKTLGVGVLFYNPQTNSSCKFESQLDETNVENILKVSLGKKERLYNKDNSPKEMKKLIALIKQFESKYAPNKDN